jgi:hemoglobin
MNRADKNDIKSLDDIKLLVNTFYSKVREDGVLGPIFEERIKGNWQPHLEKMYKFWQTVLAFDHTYSGRPFDPHTTMPIDALHFERWIGLFFETVDELFQGDKAEEIKTKASNTAKVFEYKLQHLKTNGFN